MIVLLYEFMPRPKSYTKDTIALSALHQFWNKGFEATSMDDLVRETKASRHAIYSECGNKDDLFLACLEVYQREVVDPAFKQVEAANASLQSIQNYFEAQIDLAGQAGPPYPGCLVANTMTETGPHDPKVLTAVRAHNMRLENGFLNALENENAQAGSLNPKELQKLASFLATSTQGLWAFSRSLSDTHQMHEYATTLLQLIKRRISG